MSYHASVIIDAPADIIWSRMIDVERWHETTASVTAIQRLDQGPFQVGSSARVKQPKIPTVVWTVSDLQPQREFTWETPAPGFNTIGRHAMTPTGDGRYTLTLGIDRTGPLAWLVDRLTATITRTYVDMEAAGMKRVCEAEARAAIPA